MPRIAALTLATIAALAVSSAAQVAAPKGPKVNSSGKKQGGAGATQPTTGKKSRVTGSIYDAGRGTGTTTAAGTPSAAAARILLGERVRGHVGGGASDTILFEAVAGSKLSIAIAPEDRRLTLAATVRDSSGAAVVGLAPTRKDPARLELVEFELAKTDTFRLDVGFTANQSGTYEVETKVDAPTRLEEDWTLADGRPRELRVGGMDGRRLDELKLRVTGEDPLRLAVRIVDPDGLELPVGDFAWTATDEGTVIVTNLPLQRIGEYRIYAADKSRASGTVKVTARFTNPSPEKKVHEL